MIKYALKNSAGAYLQYDHGYWNPVPLASDANQFDTQDEATTVKGNLAEPPCSMDGLTVVKLKITVEEVF